MGATHLSGLNVGPNVAANAAGAGSSLSLIVKGSVSIDLPSIAAGAEADVSVTITGAAVGDNIIINPPALTAGLGLSYARVSAANTVILRVRNASAGVIDEVAKSFQYLIVR